MAASWPWKEGRHRIRLRALGRIMSAFANNNIYEQNGTFYLNGQAAYNNTRSIFSMAQLPVTAAYYLPLETLLLLLVKHVRKIKIRIRNINNKNI